MLVISYFSWKQKSEHKAERTSWQFSLKRKHYSTSTTKIPNTRMKMLPKQQCSYTEGCEQHLDWNSSAGHLPLIVPALFHFTKPSSHASGFVFSSDFSAPDQSSSLIYISIYFWILKLPIKFYCPIKLNIKALYHVFNIIEKEALKCQKTKSRNITKY